jgi:hypothetical protein
MDGAPKAVELAIVATTADVRLDVLRSMKGALSVKSLLLEKVLFQDLRHYEQAKGILGDLATRTWVNCSQRLWPFFVDLRERFFNDTRLEITISGSNWGLGCNAVHNTDIAEFLWSQPATHEAALDARVLESKRPGFKEFTGRLTTTTLGGGRLSQISYASGAAPFVVNVTHPTERVCWDITNGRVSVANQGTAWNWVTSNLAAPFQSQLTAKVAEAILNDKACGLPDFFTSARIHVATLAAILAGASRNGHDFGNVCPVT